MTHRGGLTSPSRRGTPWRGHMTNQAKMCICHLYLYRGKRPAEILPLASDINARAGGENFPDGWGSSQIQNVIRSVTGPLYVSTEGCSYRYPQDPWLRGMYRNGFHYLWLILLTSETPPSDWPKLIRDSGITSTTGSIDVIDGITPDNLHFMVGRPVRPGVIDISVDDLSTMLATVIAAVRYAQRMNSQLHLPVVVSGSSSASSSSSLRPADINLILDAYRRGCGPGTQLRRRGRGSRFRELLSQVKDSPPQPLALPATRGALSPTAPQFPQSALRSAEREMQQEEDLAPATGTGEPLPEVVAIAASEA
mmetsp:Transcript_59866/g.81893  ORF Transcript_59866/g.81893 Transcript_59866/m.81893 type:complete len:309 (-) Transcript_59866:318-1244(-)